MSLETSDQNNTPINQDVVATSNKVLEYSAPALSL